MTEKLDELIDAFIDLNYEECLKIVKQKLLYLPARAILIDGLIVGLRRVGDKFECKEYFLSDLIFASQIMNECVRILEPELKKETTFILAAGSAVIGTVKGDVHDIGKNVFGTLIASEGFRIIDLGADVPVDNFIQAVKEHKPDIIGLSALLSTTAPYFKVVSDALRAEGYRDKTYLMIGGPPYISASDAGADIYCHDAFLGVKKAVEYMNKKKESP